MFDTMYEAKEDEETGMFYVRPVKPQESPYVVAFSTAQDAKMFCVRLTMGEVRGPSEDPTSYRQAGVLKDGLTRIYHLK